jgi:nitrous oxidase accessory protein NosD
MRKSTCSFLLLCATAVPIYAQGRTEFPITHNMVIDTPGMYLLTRDLSAANGETALTIRAGNVTIDLNGHRISGPGANSGTGILIDGATGVQVRNGYVSDLGFGVTVANSNSVTIEGLQITGRGIAVSAPPPEVGIMVVNSKSVVIRHNSMFGVGLGVFVRGPRSMGNHVYENTISASSNGLLGVCYNPAPGAPGGPRGDTVERNAISGFRFAIQVNAGGPNVFRNNTLLYTVDAFETAAGTILEDTGNVKVQLP